MSNQKREARARKAQRAANRQQDRRNFGVVVFGGLVMFAVGLGALWFAGVSIRRGYVHLQNEPDLVYAAEDPVAFWISTGSLAAIGVFCAAMGLQGVMHARGELRRTPRPARRLPRTDTRRR